MSDFVIENGVLIKYTGKDSDVVIPDGVTSISWRAFEGCSSLTSVTIPDSVTKIGNEVFWGCRNLSNMAIGNGVTEIGDSKFSYYTGLKSVILSDSITSIGNRAFEGCSSLTSVTIPDSVITIGKEAFWGCSSLTKVTIGSGVTEIGDSAFSHCSSLKSVTIPNSVMKIGGAAFFGCRSLTNVTIGNGAVIIGYSAFKGCNKLESITLPESKNLSRLAEECNDYDPLCRAATEEQMAELIKAVAKWDRYNKEAFYVSYMISDTRAAILLAEKRKELDKYADMRGMTADEVRDRLLSDFGLDADGCKEYDLGNTVVKVKMLPDFTFAVDLPDGKISKSLPKKGADEKKFKEADKDFSEMKKNVKKVWKNRSDLLLSDFVSGKKRAASYWKKTYTGNPVLRGVAKLIVWEQNGKYFTLADGGTIGSDGSPYELTKESVRLAHPLEMSKDDVTSWQKYYTDRGLKQPFAQIWEPVHKPENIKSDRYKNCPILFFALQGATKHGFNEKLNIPGCTIKTEWKSEKAANGNSVSYCNILDFNIEKYSRAVNHAVAYLDRTTVLGRIAKDDLSVMDYVEGSNIAQITDYIEAASNAKAVNVLAALMEYKNKTYPDFDPMAEFTLEW